MSDDHKFWVVFALYEGTVPYLEFYQNRQNVTNLNVSSDGPVSKHNLLTCRHICPVITHNRNENPNEFTIALDTHVIRLAADTQEVMFDWIDSLKSKLIFLNILKSSENFYSKSPTFSHPNNTDELNDSDNNELYEPIFQVTRNLQQISLNRTSPRIPDDEGPPPYECIFNNSENSSRAPISFREAQVEKLKKEMQNSNGIPLKVFSIHWPIFNDYVVNVFQGTS